MSIFLQIKSSLSVIAISLLFNLVSPIVGAASSFIVEYGTNLNARSGPGTNFGKVKRLEEGTKLEELERKGSWSKVRTQEGDVVWVHNGYITADLLSSTKVKPNTAHKHSLKFSVAKIHSKLTTSYSLSRDEKLLATAHGLRDAAVTDLKSQAIVWALETGPFMTSIDIHPTAPLIIIGTSRGYIDVWNIETNKKITQLKMGEAEVVKVFFDEDGGRFAVIDEFSKVSIWNSQSFKRLDSYSLATNKKKNSLFDICDDHESVLYIDHAKKLKIKNIFSKEDVISFELPDSKKADLYSSIACGPKMEKAALIANDIGEISEVIFKDKKLEILNERLFRNIHGSLKSYDHDYIYYIRVEDESDLCVLSSGGVYCKNNDFFFTAVRYNSYLGDNKPAMGYSNRTSVFFYEGYEGLKFKENPNKNQNGSVVNTQPKRESKSSTSYVTKIKSQFQLEENNIYFIRPVAPISKMRILDIDKGKYFAPPGIEKLSKEIWYDDRVSDVRRIYDDNGPSFVFKTKYGSSSESIISLSGFNSQSEEVSFVGRANLGTKSYNGFSTNMLGTLAASWSVKENKVAFWDLLKNEKISEFIISKEGKGKNIIISDVKFSRDNKYANIYFGYSDLVYKIDFINKNKIKINIKEKYSYNKIDIPGVFEVLLTGNSFVLSSGLYREYDIFEPKTSEVSDFLFAESDIVGSGLSDLYFYDDGVAFASFDTLTGNVFLNRRTNDEDDLLGKTVRLDRQGAPVRTAQFSGDGKLFLTDDGEAARLWRVDDGKELVKIIHFTDGSWLHLTPEGFFDYSGQLGFQLVKGIEALPISQFYDALYRPDLVLEALRGDPEGKVKKAGDMLDLDQIWASGLPPIVKTLASAQGISVDLDKIDVEADLTLQSGGVGRVEIKVNGATQIVKTLPKTDGGNIKLVQPVFLTPGKNQIEIIAYNSSDLIASSPKSMEVVSTAQPQNKPNLHILAIGVDKYQDEAIAQLNYAVNDATTIGQALSKAGRDQFENIILTEVTNEQASKHSLDAIFTQVGAKARPEDVFILFLSGHGKTEDGRYYFLPSDFKYEGPQSFKEKGIGQSQWQQWLARIPAQRSVLLYDTCESGSLARDSLNEGLEVTAAINRLTRATGRTIMTASTDTEPALEGYGGHGVFSYLILEAIGVADKDRDGQLEVTELADHIEKELPEVSFKAFNHRQVPVTAISGDSFSIGKPTIVIQ
ncbi:MAG: caspase family protein [Cohaesibacter sp.]|jgi:uncharacterized protein YraI|nr:caspase family protein [Cohaesibacter sp.]